MVASIKRSLDQGLRAKKIIRPMVGDQLPTITDKCKKIKFNTLMSKEEHNTLHELKVLKQKNCSFLNGNSFFMKMKLNKNLFRLFTKILFWHEK